MGGDRPKEDAADGNTLEEDLDQVMRALGPPEPIGELDWGPEPLEDQRRQAPAEPESLDDDDRGAGEDPPNQPDQ